MSRCMLTTTGELTVNNKVPQKVTIVMRRMSGQKICQAKVYFSDQGCSRKGREICGLESHQHKNLECLFPLHVTWALTMLFSTSSSKTERDISCTTALFLSFKESEELAKLWMIWICKAQESITYIASCFRSFKWLSISGKETGEN